MFLLHVYNPQIKSPDGKSVVMRSFMKFSIFNLNVRPAKHKYSCKEIIFYKDKCRS